MTTYCPACNSAIGRDDVNVSADTALCRACGHATTYSSLVHAPTSGVTTSPPDGCHVEEVGGHWRAVASCRAWQFFVILPGAVFWNGVVGGFLGVAFSNAPWGLLLLVPLAGHIGVGGYLLWMLVCLAMGDVEVMIDEDLVSTSTGFGTVRRRFRRPLRDVRTVRVDADRTRRKCLVLDGVRPLKFGVLLRDDRRQFLHAAIAGELRRRAMPRG